MKPFSVAILKTWSLPPAAAAARLCRRRCAGLRPAEKILVEVGSKVKAGDLLAEIDTTVYAARVEASRAQLRNQQAQLLDRKAQLSLAQIQLKRQQQMHKDEATSLEELQISEANAQSAEAQFKSLEAQIAQTQSSLKVEEANLAYAKIYAPMDGTVVSISAARANP